MEITSNIDELIKRFERVANEAATVDVSDALLAGVNDAKAQMETRIFNNGRDKENKSFGTYTGRTTKITKGKFASQHDDNAKLKKQKATLRRNIKKKAAKEKAERFTEYEKLRLSKGRQIGYKDLEFYGSLRRAIITANEGNDKAVCIINNEQEAKIAEYQENQIGKIRGSGRVEIFGVNQTEIDTCVQTTNGVLKQVFNDLFKK